MNAINLLREQLKWAHGALEATMTDVSHDVAHFSETNKALPVGAAYAHALIGEDMVVATMLAHTTPLSQSNPDVGVSEPMPGFDKWDQHEQWYKTVKVDIPKLQAYARDVAKATDDYIASLKEEDLETEVDLGAFGKHTIADIVSNFMILHMANLTGEISSVKGLQGLKGYPW